MEHRERREMAWVPAIGRWMPTGHIVGRTPIEFWVRWLEITRDELDKYRSKLEGQRSRFRWDGRPYRNMTRRLDTLYAIVKATQEQLVRYRNEAEGEAAQRRALFAQRLVCSPGYVREYASRRLIDAQIAELEAIRFSIEETEGGVPEAAPPEPAPSNRTRTKPH